MDLNLFFNLHYEEIGNDTYSNNNMKDTQMEEFNKLVGLRFPYCLMHYCLTNLGETFHLVSILLTACLGLQKIHCGMSNMEKNKDQ